jgi:hypothetical protein
MWLTLKHFYNIEKGINFNPILLAMNDKGNAI